MQVPILIICVYKDIPSIWSIHCPLNYKSLCLNTLQCIYERLQQQMFVVWAIVHLLGLCMANVEYIDARQSRWLLISTKMSMDVSNA